MRILQDITIIEGSADVLSADYPALFAVQGKHFISVNHFIAFEKAKLFRDMDAAHRIWSSADALEISSLSRLVKGFDAGNWARHRLGITVKADLAKFDDNPELASVLLSTGATKIGVAGSVHGLRGLTLAATDPAILDSNRWCGLNIEGRALMDVREILVTRSKPKAIRWDTTPEPVSVAHKIDMCSSWFAGYCSVVPQEHWLPALQALPEDELRHELLAYMKDVRFLSPEICPDTMVFLAWVEESFGFRLKYPTPTPNNAST